jgi:LmbE family N-acetylglucosaminyl deacetylase
VPILGRRLLGRQVFLCLSLCALGLSPAAADPGDDRYVFSAAASRGRGLVLVRRKGSAKVALSIKDVGRADTLLLGLHVQAVGEAPRLRARIGKSTVDHYLEPGAQGLRWLSLTGLRSALGKATQLELETEQVTITSSNARLRLFENHLPFARSTLVLAPHPDDAEIAAFGLYTQHAARTHVVTVTAGNAGAPTYRAEFPEQTIEQNSEQYQLKGVLRVIDSVTVPWQGGVPPERCYNLGYFDARLDVMYEKKAEPVSEMYGPNRDLLPYRRANLAALLPNTSRLNSWQNLVEDLVQVLARTDPEVVVLPHPLLDTHPDHQFVAVAVAEAVARHEKPLAFLLYTNHADNDLYPYGPAGGALLLPPSRTADLPVQGLYALPIERALRRRKLFALESMHDLRPSPAEQMHAGERPVSVDSPRYPSTDYFRRAARSEELFFVVDRAGLYALVQRFLDALKQTP